MSKDLEKLAAEMQKIPKQRLSKRPPSKIIRKAPKDWTAPRVLQVRP